MHFVKTTVVVAVAVPAVLSSVFHKGMPIVLSSSKLQLASRTSLPQGNYTD